MKLFKSKDEDETLGEFLAKERLKEMETTNESHIVEGKNPFRVEEKFKYNIGDKVLLNDKCPYVFTILGQKKFNNRIDMEDFIIDSIPVLNNNYTKFYLVHIDKIDKISQLYTGSPIQKTYLENIENADPFYICEDNISCIYNKDINIGDTFKYMQDPSSFEAKLFMYEPVCNDDGDIYVSIIGEDDLDNNFYICKFIKTFYFNSNIPRAGIYQFDRYSVVNNDSSTKVIEKYRRVCGVLIRISKSDLSDLSKYRKVAWI